MTAIQQAVMGTDDAQWSELKRRYAVHDDLVAALRDIEQYARTKHTQRDGPKFDVIRDKARAALARATEGE